jgi:hypothetical protein
MTLAFAEINGTRAANFVGSEILLRVGDFNFQNKKVLATSLPKRDRMLTWFQDASRPGCLMLLG